MANKKKGKKYKVPNPAPKGYLPKPNDRVLDYTQTIERAKVPRIRRRYLKVDGFDFEVQMKPDTRARKGKASVGKKKSGKNVSKR